jgi:uncharacterized SAM-binding protein YcdF (DUF218 family)
MGIPFSGEDYYDTQILIHQGVPKDAIRLLAPAIVNTADEIRAIASELEHEKDRTVILVTSKVHTRRASMLWRRLAGGRGRAILHAAADDPFDPSHWWRTTGDALEVVREILGLINAWAGLPLQPAH